MKRILAPLAATGLVLASTAAQAAPIERAPAATGEAEGIFGGEGYPNGILMLLLSILAAIPLGLGMLILVPVGMISLYVCYKDIFLQG